MLELMRTTTRSRSFTLLFTSLIAAASAGGCGTEAHAAGDAGLGDASTRCNPAETTCRATLRCRDYDDCDALRLADGEVQPATAEWQANVEANIGRYLVLRGTDPLCRFADSGDGSSTQTFDSLDAIPSTGCTWEGASVLCGVNTTPYSPACEGRGVLMQVDRASYRFRIVEDGSDAEGWFLDVEWSAR